MNRKLLSKIFESMGRGGYVRAGKKCGVTPRAAWYWANRYHLPRTELTGETNYAAELVALAPGVCTTKQLHQECSKYWRERRERTAEKNRASCAA